MRPDSEVYTAQQLANKLVGVPFYFGTHYLTLHMLEGFLTRDQIKLCQAPRGSRYRLESVMKGEIESTPLTEPYLTLAEKKGCRIVVSASLHGTEVASENVDAETYAMFNRAVREAVRRVNADKKKYMQYFIDYHSDDPEIAAIRADELRDSRIRGGGPGADPRRRAGAHRRLDQELGHAGRERGGHRAGEPGRSAVGPLEPPALAPIRDGSPRGLPGNMKNGISQLRWNREGPQGPSRFYFFETRAEAAGDCSQASPGAGGGAGGWRFSGSPPETPRDSPEAVSPHPASFPTGPEPLPGRYAFPARRLPTGVLRVHKEQDFCGSLVPDQTLVAASDGALKNVVVTLHGPGLDRRPVRPRAIQLDNIGCRFAPSRAGRPRRQQNCSCSTATSSSTTPTRAWAPARCSTTACPGGAG